jgi:hypothetical protein
MLFFLSIAKVQTLYQTALTHIYYCITIITFPSCGRCWAKLWLGSGRVVTEEDSSPIARGSEKLCNFAAAKKQ